MAEDRAESEAGDLERRWAAIRGRMEAAAEALERQGSIASRRTGGGTRVYSVRYKAAGGRRQRAIYLGRDGELVRRARELLGAYREGERQVREVEEAARIVVAGGAALRQLLGTRPDGPRRRGGS